IAVVALVALTAAVPQAHRATGHSPAAITPGASTPATVKALPSTPATTPAAPVPLAPLPVGPGIYARLDSEDAIGLYVLRPGARAWPALRSVQFGDGVELNMAANLVATNPTGHGISIGQVGVPGTRAIVTLPTTSNMCRLGWVGGSNELAYAVTTKDF